VTSKEENGGLKIIFRDTGTGMSKETLSKLWRPLFTTKAKGMGFGLPICKRIVEAHRGKISVESIFGQGTQFTIKIPADPKAKLGDLWVFNPPPTITALTKQQVQDKKEES
jgi:signal transduction histidine kinase